MARSLQCLYINIVEILESQQERHYPSRRLYFDYTRIWCYIEKDTRPDERSKSPSWTLGTSTDLVLFFLEIMLSVFLEHN